MMNYWQLCMKEDLSELGNAFDLVSTYLGIGSNQKRIERLNCKLLDRPGHCFIGAIPLL